MGESAGFCLRQVGLDGGFAGSWLRGVDSLDVACGCLDVAPEIELQSDPGRAWPCHVVSREPALVNHHQIARLHGRPIESPVYVPAHLPSRM